MVKPITPKYTSHYLPISSTNSLRTNENEKQLYYMAKALTQSLLSSKKNITAEQGYHKDTSSTQIIQNRFGKVWNK